ncbi:MAG: HAD-IA family hydrolase [Lachnospiraceae bacterium]|nr:HAD-IA family hydrolase [Lachnospiraceae bacterium]
MNRCKAAIFDMDGTVLNTLPDLANGIRHAFAECGSTYHFTDADAAEFFGSGVHVAIMRAMLRENGASAKELEIVGTPEGSVLTDPLDKDRISELEQSYRAFYSAHNDDLTDAYEGILPLLRELRAAGILTAVVSNKPDKDCRKLAENYFPGGFDCCLGEKPELPRKPAPDMTLQVLKELDTAPEEAVYIGDSEIDLQTAVNAGLPCIMVTWGFRSGDFIREAVSDMPEWPVEIVDTPDRIAGLLIGT